MKCKLQKLTRALKNLYYDNLFAAHFSYQLYSTLSTVFLSESITFTNVKTIRDLFIIFD